MPGKSPASPQLRMAQKNWPEPEGTGQVWTGRLHVWETWGSADPLSGR